MGAIIPSSAEASPNSIKKGVITTEQNRDRDHNEDYQLPVVHHEPGLYIAAGTVTVPKERNCHFCHRAQQFLNT